MLRIRYLDNIYQKRTLRLLYGQTATPYAAVLDPSLLGPGQGDPDTFTDTYTFPAAAYTYQGGLVPGTVMQRGTAGENVLIASGVAGTGTGLINEPQAFGLLANFVGGNLDELGGDPYVGVWLGQDSVYEILSPAFNSTGLAAAYAAATPGYPVLLYAGLDGRLCVGGAGGPFGGAAGNRQVVANLLNVPSASRIVIQLLV